MKRMRYTVIVALCSMLIPLFIYCKTGIPIPVVTNMPKDFGAVMQGKKNVGVILVPSKENWLQKLGYQMDWTAVVQSAVETALKDYRYFSLVDVSSQKERLMKIAESQSGITAQQKQIGQQLALDALLFIQMTAQPLYECKVEEVLDKAAIAQNVMRAAQGQPLIPTKQPTGIMYLTVFVSGKLVNVETGRSIPQGSNKPFRKENGLGNTSCPSILDSFDGALQFAAQTIATGVSPKIEDIQVIVESDPIGASDATKKNVEAYLKQGIKWAGAKPPNLEKAAELWKKALDTSGGKSASAYWNLAIYKWSTGDLIGAKEYFAKAEKAADNPDWISAGDRMDTVSKFEEEKKRLDKEKKAANE